MPQQDYSWKRFWCPRTGNISLADFGFLYDPDSEYGKQLNPDVIAFDVIASVPCLVMLGEAGMGKSTTAIQVYEEVKAAGREKCLWVSLGDYNTDAGICHAILDNADFKNWLQGDDRLHLFLDSLDEGLLSLEILVRILKRELVKLPCDRLSLRITCRTADWPASLEEKLRERWGGDHVGVYELTPLRRIDVIEAAKENNLDTDEFIQAIFDREAVPLAIKPVTLKFLINTYKQNEQFPPTQRELYYKGCEILCAEINPDRLESGFRGELSDKQRVIVAAQIAAIFIFANRSAIWTSTDFGDVPSSDVAITELCIGSEQINDHEFQVTEQNIRETLSITGLFSSRGNNRMGFAHQTYAEFLAAWYVAEHRKLPLKQIASLLVAPEDPERRLVPQLHETAAWIACWRDDVLKEIMESDPDVVLRSDIPTDASVCAMIVDNLLTRYEQGIVETFDGRVNNYRHLKKLRHPHLADQLRLYIQDRSRSLEVRNRAIDIAEVCEEHSVQGEIADIVLNSTEDIYLRGNAAHALTLIGDSTTKLRLKPLAVAELPEDEDDQVKGYSLIAVWSEHMSAEELFQALTPPKRRNFGGGYSRFLSTELVKQLNPLDLTTALTWVAKQGLRHSQHPFESVADAVLLFAWEHLETPGILEIFARIALIQWKEYQKVVTESWKPNFEQLLLDSDEKRHKLLEAVVLLVAEEIDGDPSFFVSTITDVSFFANDFFWILERLQAAISEQVQEIWAKLLQWNFNDQDAKKIDALVVETQKNPFLQAKFGAWFQAVEFNSPQAKEMKAHYRDIQEWVKCDHPNQSKRLSIQEIKDRIEYYLDEFETGNLDAWWLLNREMSLKLDNPYYDDLEIDLTNLFGWKEADLVTRRRILDAARSYAADKTDPENDWIGTNTYNRPSLAGCRALYLLLKEDSMFLTSISSSTWLRWTPAIVAFPHAESEQESTYVELVKQSYSKAPFEFIDTVLLLINAESRNSNYISIMRMLEECWDDRLKEAVLNKVKLLDLQPKCIGQLLEELLKHNHKESREFAKSLLSWSNDEERQIAISAACVLLEYAQELDWDVFWNTIKQDESFGKEAIEQLVDRYSRGIQMPLNEQQLADLYIWLEQHYPHQEDPVHDTVHHVGMRESMVGFRDTILAQLKETGTQQACGEIQRVIQHFPEYNRLKWTLQEAHHVLRRKSWQPLKPSQFLQLLSDSDKRLVQDGNQLLAVLIEELEKLERKFQDQTPAAIDLWNEIEWGQVKRLFSGLSAKIKSLFKREVGFDFNDLKDVDWRKLKGSTYLPREEERISDYIARYLRDSLKSRGIILNREVEIRRGEITDIQVNAVLKTPTSKIYDTLTVIIEIKGCWNNELNTAMKTQLVNRYLRDNTCQYGLYLVGWFNCNQWDDGDSRKAKTKGIGSITEARERLDRQAEGLSQSGVTVRSFVLNAALR
jgi:predicted NACHT family NTPase